MVMPYRPTRENRILSTRPSRFFRRKKIDVRWQGGWLSLEGTYLSGGLCKVHYPRNHCRGTRKPASGSGSIMTRPPVMRLFDFGGWMRISYFKGDSFCVELKGDFLDETRQNVLLNFIRDYKGFDEYYLNDGKHATYQRFILAISGNAVTPTRRKRRGG